MDEIVIFFSWAHQNHDNRKLINKCLNKAKKELVSDDIQLIIDEATRDEFGSPSISETILSKIQNSDFFVCDISGVISNESTLIPNPNVLFELGFACSELGHRRVIMLFNKSSGNDKLLPFDIRNNRYTLIGDEESLVRILVKTVKSLRKREFKKLDNFSKILNRMNLSIDELVVSVGKSVAVSIKNNINEVEDESILNSWFYFIDYLNSQKVEVSPRVIEDFAKLTTEELDKFKNISTKVAYGKHIPKDLIGLYIDDIAALREARLIDSSDTISFETFVKVGTTVKISNKNMCLVFSNSQTSEQRIVYEIYHLSKLGMLLFNSNNYSISDENLIKFGRILKERYKNIGIAAYAIISQRDNEFVYNSALDYLQNN